jgi:hypothetical protein
MTEPAAFHINPSGRIEVVLGIHRIGIIEPWDGGQAKNSFGKIGAYYWSIFDGGMRHPATSTKIARRLILHRLSQWFEAGGPFAQSLAEAFSLQAETER